jgi:hypothetical protein
MNLKRPNGDSEWSQFKQGGAVEATSELELRQEYADLEGNEQFLKRALSQGRLEMERLVDIASAEICQSYRPQFISLTAKLLQAVRTISEVNSQLFELRSGLEAAGVKTGSLAPSQFQLGGEWGDKWGGRIVEWQKYVASEYPELKKEAS